MRTPLFLATLLLALSACAQDSNVAAERTRAPLIGDEDGADSADHQCHIVLRELARAPGPGGYETTCIDDGSCWFVWEGLLDISDQAKQEGALPRVSYFNGSGEDWFVVDGTETEGAASGYQRYSFRFFDHTVSPGQSLTSLVQSRIQVAAFLMTESGSRVFDHNRLAGALDNYLLDSDSSWSVQAAPEVCGAPAPVAVQLASAQVYTQLEYPAITHTTMRGTVHANGNTDQQSVMVHYRIHEGNNLVRDWSSVDAVQIAANEWEFETPVFDSACPHYCPRHVYQFAIAHDVDGITHWDNNGGEGVDYVIADDVGGSVPAYYGPPGILEDPVQLSYMSWQGGSASGVVRGVILLKNLAYQKKVYIEYSQDDWQSREELPAQFMMTSYDDLEYWQFFLPLDDAPTNLLLAIRYEVDGVIYRDDNFGRSYQLSVTP